MKVQLTAQMGAQRALPAGGAQPGRPPKEVTIEEVETASSGSGPASATAAAPKPKPTPKPVPDNRDAGLEAAVEALDAQRYASSAALLDAIIAKNGKNARAFHYRALVELSQNNVTDSVKHFARSVELDAKSFDTWFNYGDALSRLGKTKEAEEAFAKAVALKEDIFAMLNLAEARKKLGKGKEALELYERVLKIEPNSLEAKLNKADALADEGKAEEGNALVNEVLVADGKNAQAHFVKGRILMRGELYEDAVTEFRAATTASPGNEYYMVHLARALVAARKYPEVVDIGNRIMKTNPANLEARFLVAEGLMMAGDVDNAEVHLDELEKVQKDARTMTLRAKLARRLNQHEKADGLYQQAIAADPANAELLLEFARYQEEVGSNSVAIEIYQTIREKFPNSHWSGIADTKLGPIEEAASGGSDQPKPEPGKVKY